MKTAHTPGPWHSHNPGSGVEILDTDNRIVAGNVARHPWKMQTHLANVALITAAPDLLAALEKAEAALAYRDTDDYTRDVAISAARAAIAKAKA